MIWAWRPNHVPLTESNLVRLSRFIRSIRHRKSLILAQGVDHQKALSRRPGLPRIILQQRRFIGELLEIAIEGKHISQHEGLFEFKWAHRYRTGFLLLFFLLFFFFLALLAFLPLFALLQPELGN